MLNLTEGDFVAQISTREYPRNDTVDISKLAGRNSICVLNLPRNDPRTFILSTAGRVSCDAVCVWGRRRGGDDVFISHYYQHYEIDHLNEIRTKAPKRGITVVMICFAYYHDENLFRAQFDQQRDLALDIHGGPVCANYLELYQFYKSNYPVIEVNGILLFDLREDFREKVSDLLKVDPYMWYVPILPADYEAYIEKPHLFQLTVGKILGPNKKFKRLIYASGTGKCLFID